MKKSALKKIANYSLFTFISAATAQAQTARIVGDPEAVMGPKSSSRGAATTGSHLVHDSIFQNPASAALEKSYTVTVGYSPLGDQLTASIVDTNSSTIGGAVSYVRRDLRDLGGTPLELGNYKRTEDRAALSFFGMADKNFGIGIIGKYAYQKSYDSMSSTGKNWNGDVGAKYIFNRYIQAGAVAQNVLKDDTGINVRAFSVGIETLPMRSMNLSARIINYPKPGSSAQYRFKNDSKPTGFALGMEYAVYQGVALRAGYKDQPTWNEKVASAGLGLNGKDYGADYSFQMSTLGDKSIAHMATLFGRF